MISKPKPIRQSASDLDDRLSGPQGQAVKKEYLNKLESYFSKVKASINKGDLNPTEYEAARCTVDAILQSMVILYNYRELDKI